MKPTFKSPLWRWGILLPALLFILWSVSLIQSVTRLQDEVSRNVALINKMNTIEETIRDMENGMFADTATAWQPLILNFQSQRQNLAREELSRLRLDSLMKRIDFFARRLDSLHVQRPSRQLGNAETGIFTATFHRNLQQAIDAVKSAVQAIRRRQTAVSIRFAQKWREMNRLVMISCLLAIFLSVVLLLHQRDQARRRRTEAALRESEARYRTLIERLSDGVYRSTPEGKFIEVNPAMAKMLGYASKEELMAIDIKKQLYFDEQERETVVHKLRRAGGDEIDVFRLRHKTGREIWVEDHGQLVADDRGDVIYHEGILRDISARRHAEEALRESEERYRSVIGALAEGVVLYDADGSIIASNASAERIFGLSAAQLQGRHTADPHWRAIHEDGSPFPSATHPAAISLDSGQACANVVMGVHKPGRALAWISINSQPLLRPGETKPYAAVASFYEISERKWAEEALRESEERYRLLAENSLDLIELIDLDGNVMYASPSHYYVIGYTPNELVYQNLFGIVHREDAPQALAAINGLRDSTARKTIELRLQQKNGDWIAMEALLSGIPGPGNAVHRILFSARDITARRQAEEHLKGSLKEKEVLLKEIHHRVKNNLQIISSLLNLQSGYIQDKHAGEMFKESRNRVKSMALIHERLYQSKDLARIDFAEYVRNLTTHLFRSYGVNAQAVGLKIDVDKIPLDIDTAMPCGLIINELVTNSLKYAFPPGVAGEIRIELHRENAGQLMLIVSDNGAGLPENFDLQNAGSLGLQLINTLADQLEGRILLERGGGTTFKILLQPHHGLDSQGTSDGAQNRGTSFSR